MTNKITLTTIVSAATLYSANAAAQSYCPTTQATEFQYQLGTETKTGKLTAAVTVQNEQPQYRAGDHVKYTVDLSVIGHNGRPMIVSKTDIAYWLAPVGSVADQSTYVKIHGKSEPRNAALPQGDVDATENVLIPASLAASGPYALFATGDFYVAGQRHRIRSMSCDTIQVTGSVGAAPVSVSSSAPEESTPWSIRTGRHGANMLVTNESGDLPEGMVIVDGQPHIDRFNVSYGQEFKVDDNCFACESDEKPRPRGRAESLETALFAVHAIQEPERDLDRDIDICTKPGRITPLDFDQSYEVVQRALRVRPGATLAEGDVQPSTTVQFAGLNIAVNQEDEFYLVKVWYVESNDRDGYQEGRDQVRNVDVLKVDVHNRTPHLAF